MKTLLFALLAVLIIAGCEKAPTRTTDFPPVVTKAGISEVSPLKPGLRSSSLFAVHRRPLADEYAEGHAYRHPKHTPRDVGGDLDRSRNEKVYIICELTIARGRPRRSSSRRGVSRAIVVTGGTEAWKDAGMPMGSSNMYE